MARGDLYLDPAVAEKALPGAPARPLGFDVSSAAHLLSPREDAVLRLTAQGFSNEIATRMEVSVKTVQTYKSRAAEKLGLGTRAEIVRYGTSRGWLNETE